MAAFNFPNTPTEGQTFAPIAGGPVYIYNGTQWRMKEAPPPPPVVGGIPEAPLDGAIYGRQSSGWASVTYTSLPGKPSTFPPTLPIAESGVTGLVSDLAAKAPLASPVFTGNPTAPTATAGDSDTSIATTAFVTDAVTTSNTTQNIAIALKANIASPVFTGDPQAPTPLSTDNDTSIATTAFVQAALVASGISAGACVGFARNSAPAGWLKANGAAISRTTYAALFAVSGGGTAPYGPGDGSTTFNVPDLRGEFIRGWDDARGVDTGRVFGSAQTGGLESHVHAVSITTGGVSAGHTHAISITTGTESADHTHSFSDSSSATGTGSANHTHTEEGPTTTAAAAGGATFAAFSASANQATSSSGAAHTHTVAVSGTTGGRSAAHTHLTSGTSGAQSVDHTHLTSGTSAANTGAIGETRPRNIALLNCIKY